MENHTNTDTQTLMSLLNMKVRSEEIMYELLYTVVGSYCFHGITAGDEGLYPQVITTKD